MSKNEARMTFTEHLAELRTRIIRSAIAIMVGFAISYFLSDYIFKALQRPLQPLRLIVEKEEEEKLAAEKTAWKTIAPLDPAYLNGFMICYSFEDEDFRLISPPLSTVEEAGIMEKEKDEEKGPWTVLNPFEPILMKLKLAGYGGLTFAFPIILYQICAFIFPGLKKREKKAAQFLIGGCGILAIAGVMVAYFLVFPLVVPYLSNFVPEGVSVQYRMRETVNLIVKGLLAFAAAFQFPMVVFVLVYMDLLSPATLKKYRRVAIVGMAVGAAILTPPDPLSMIMMCLPLMVLYELSILGSYIIIKMKKKSAEAES